MARYALRKCPKCRDRFGMVVRQEPDSNGERHINAHCAVCGFALKGWRLILGRKQAPDMRWARIPNVRR